MAETEGTTILSQNNTDGGEAVDEVQTDETSEVADQVTVTNEVEDNADPIEEGIKAEGDEKPEEKKEDPLVPEKYEFKVPDGMSLNEKALEGFTPLAKELGLTQEKAQQVVDMGAKLVEGALKDQESAIEAMKVEWAEQVKKDAELGGAKFQENVDTAIKARDTFGTPELSQILDQSGLGNHPEMIRFFNKVGKAISEDTLVTDNTSPKKETSFAESHYPGAGLVDG